MALAAPAAFCVLAGTLAAIGAVAVADAAWASLCVGLAFGASG